MHIGVCDDSPEYLLHIRTLLEEYCIQQNGLVSYEVFHSAAALLDVMQTQMFDLLLLDILMPGLTGMAAAREIRQSGGNVPIIFLTSSREFAVESYRVGATGYMMKPVQKDELFPALDRQLAKLTQEDAYLPIQAEGSLIRLPFSQIAFVEVIAHTIRIALADGQVRETTGRFCDYESALLTDSNFYKPHRSYLVNLRLVTQLDKSGFLTTSGKTVPVARDAFAAAKAAYMKVLLFRKGAE